jgi:hypothetical protein
VTQFDDRDVARAALTVVAICAARDTARTALAQARRGRLARRLHQFAVLAA